ncbi:MAG: hypothetical protein AB7G88_08800 [Thermomicrobiales bacterium]
MVRGRLSHRDWLRWRLAVTGLGVLMSMAGLRTSAQQPTETAESVPIISVGVERSFASSYNDRGLPGLSPGDRFFWGPNPLFDAENLIDTGVSVMGMCAVFNRQGDCWVVETITFGLDGSTLRVHGILPGNGDQAVLTIFDGSGAFATASGTITVIANPDGQTWFRRFELTI